MGRDSFSNRFDDSCSFFNWELWRAKTNEGMVVLGKIPDGTFTLHRFNDEGGTITHVSKEKALWLTLELAPERLNYI